jgi:phenylacetate-CoA ligase
MKNYGANLLAVSAYHLTPKYKEQIIGAIEDFHPAGAFAYPSAAFILARWCNDMGRKLPFENLHTSSETILSEQRRILMATLNGKWVDHYGQAERVSFFAAFNGEDLREYTEYGITELMPLEDGRYEVIGTSLHNYAMPLFRYRTGDIVEGRQSDGSDRPIIKALSGRMEDFVTLPDGSLVGRLDLVFKGLRNIEEGQIYQSAIDNLTIRIVPAARYGDDDEKLLLRNARERLGYDIKIDVQHMVSIPRTKNGKLKFVISDVKTNEFST